MSYANYGPTYETVSVTNLFGDIDVPITADGAVPVTTNLIATAGGVEIPLVLTQGTWSVSSRAVWNPGNAGSTYQYIQCVVLVDGIINSILSGSVIGADLLSGASINVFMSTSFIITVPAGGSVLLNLRSLVSGNAAIVQFTGGFSNIVATKLSN